MMCIPFHHRLQIKSNVTITSINNTRSSSPNSTTYNTAISLTKRHSSITDSLIPYSSHNHANPLRVSFPSLSNAQISFNSSTATNTNYSSTVLTTESSRTVNSTIYFKFTRTTSSAPISLPLPVPPPPFSHHQTFITNHSLESRLSINYRLSSSFHSLLVWIASIAFPTS